MYLTELHAKKTAESQQAAQPAAVSIGSFQKTPEKPGGRAAAEEKAEKGSVSVNLNKPVWQPSPLPPPVSGTRWYLWLFRQLRQSGGDKSGHQGMLTRYMLLAGDR